VWRRCQHDQHCDPDRAAPPDVDDREEAERKQSEVDRQQHREEPSVDDAAGPDGRERDDAEQESRRDAEQHEPAPPCPRVQLARAGEQEREDARDASAATARHRTSVRTSRRAAATLRA
jgi:hypothetical protein